MAGLVRRRREIWREAAITYACRVLAGLFNISGHLRGKAVPRLSDLPPGASLLFIKPCCLGDVMLATATVREISQARPDLQLDFLVSEWARPLLEGQPRLTRVVPTGVAGSHLNWRQYLALVRRLRREKYAAALVLDRSPQLNLLPWLAGIKIRGGIDNLGRGFALNVRATQPGGVRPEAEVYLDVARVLGVKTVSPRLEYQVSQADRTAFWTKAAGLGLRAAPKLAVIHPGGGDNPDTRVLSKRWPSARFGEIAARLVEQAYRVMVIGAESDQLLVETVVATARQQLKPAQLANLSGAGGYFNLKESAALLSDAALFVGNDTGLMHLAAASGPAVVAIFGPSSPLAYGPYTARGRAVAPVKLGAAGAGLPLKEYQALSVAQGGIEAVSVEMVWEAIISLNI